jgi:SNF2 family DNA or RNA helicase
MPALKDQIIVGDAWSPLVPEQLEDIRGLLARTDIQKLGSLTLRQYLDLLRQDKIPVQVSAAVPEALVPTALLAPDKSDFSHSVKATLYPYQESGVRWLSAISAESLGCILGDEMGLGKTLQIIVLIAKEAQKTSTPNLVVCPATLLENWRRELARFAPTLTTHVHGGSARTGFPSNLRHNQVVLISYDTAVRDLSLLKMIKWNVAVIDEAQAIKNPETQRAISLRQIPRRIGIGVTGTPVENSLRDLWSIMEFACPGFLGSLSLFESRFKNDTEHALRLEPLVSPLILRRLVADVAGDLPEKIEIPQAIPLSSERAKEYDQLRETILREYGPAGGLVSLIKLRMFCAHPFLITNATEDPAAFSTKYCRLLEILDEIFMSKHKAILFTSFAKMIDLLTQDVPDRYPIFCHSIDGRTPVGDRQKIIDSFEGYDGPALLVLNPRAAGTGLNITAARHVIHYNLEWNPAVEDQATARAYRRGQKHPVTVHRLFHPGTVEEIIDDRLLQKRALAGAAVKGTEGEITDIARALSISPLVAGGQPE